ncbi:beta-lactamase [Indibacter alkaliphilus LW1]|uniref:Beta-lactamase n=1 Tax=Indibacter alkaliphilus (strain CCUG 57479 / KCTC 22604 / LW1) TaxID=1189612 RepID=S2E2N6_INDAL|nr:serine hydrolase domain-containing protein [Indibacter alkaliphilus]EOZ98751.1 beta-lactamase [Indibacter alkaliphilus LW1]
MEYNFLLITVFLLAFGSCKEKDLKSIVGDNLPDIQMTTTDQILNYEIENGSSPSIQYFFFDQHKIIDSFQKGFSDVGGQKKVDANTTYHVLSVTKTFTAIATLQLVERGLLELEKPVIHYLPHFQYGSEITVKQLLNHTSGIPNPIPLSWIHLESEDQSFDRNSFFDLIIEKNKKVKSKPNEKFAYSNLGYVILGQLIEKVSGKTFEDYIIENIVRKLPISQDDLAFSISNSHDHAKGYHKKISFSNLILGLFINKSKFMGENEGKWKPFKNYYVNGAPYGGLIGKPSAFVSYVQELMNENSSLISEKSKTMMFQENKNNPNTGMCLGWFSGELNGVKYFAHAGGGGGYYCEIRIYPKINRGSVIFFNRTGMSDERYLDKIDRFYI